MEGQNIRYDIIRNNYASDDSVGGAVVTGTTVYSSIPGRLQGHISDDEMLSLNPGIETDRIFSITSLGNRTIKENDYWRLVDPTNHPYYNLDLKIRKVVYSNFVPSDPRFYMILKVSRSVEARTIQ